MALLQIAIHEAGHLLFGLMTGYQFVTYRILRLTLAREKGRLRLRWYSQDNSLGQCIMSPLYFAEDDYPYALHILGGILFNLISGFIFVYIAICSTKTTFSVRILLLIGAFFGIGFAIINLLPSRRGSINNDGLNYYSIKRDRQALISNFCQAKILTYLMEGKSYKDIPEELVIVPEGSDIANPLIGWHKLIECYYYRELRQWEDACDCINAFKPIMKDINKALRDAVVTEDSILHMKGKLSNGCSRTV